MADEARARLTDPEGHWWSTRRQSLDPLVVGVLAIDLANKTSAQRHFDLIQRPFHHLFFSG